MRQSKPVLTALQAEEIADNLIILRRATNENLLQGADNIVPVLTEFIAGIITSSKDHLLQEEVTGKKISMLDTVKPPQVPLPTAPTF